MMRRRKYLSVGGVTIASFLAGCSGGDSGNGGSNPECTIENSTGGIDPIPIRAEGRFDEAEVTLEVRWNAQIQPSLGGDSDPPSGDLWVVFKVNVSNPSDKQIELGTFELTTETSGTIRKSKVNGVNVIGDADYIDRQLEDTTLKSGGEVSGLLFYGVGRDVTKATFGVEEASSYAFDPTCDEELGISAPL